MYAPIYMYIYMYIYIYTCIYIYIYICMCIQAESRACDRPLQQSIEVAHVNLPYDGAEFVAHLRDVRHLWRGNGRCRGTSVCTPRCLPGLPPCEPPFHALPPLPALPPSHLSPFLHGSAGLHGSPSLHGSPRHPWPHGVFVAAFCEDCIAMATTASEHQRWRVAGWLRQPPTLPLPPPLQPLQQLPPPPTLPLPMP